MKLSIKLLVCMIFLIAILPMVSATEQTLGTFKQNSEISLKQIYNGTGCNITSVNYPNGSEAMGYAAMTKDGVEYNYSYSKTDALGQYIVNGECDNNVWSYDFYITYVGNMLSEEQSNIYLFGILFLVLLIFGIGYIISKLPSKDSRDENGAIIEINNLKHLRNILWVVIWTICLAIIFLISNLSLAYLYNSLIGDLFFTIYQIMFWITIIGIPIYFCWLFYKMFKEAEIRKMIERGIEVKTP